MSERSCGCPTPSETIPEALIFWAERTPDAPALRAIDGRAWSHRELLTAVATWRGASPRCGIKDDARVALAASSWRRGQHRAAGRDDGRHRRPAQSGSDATRIAP